MYDNKYYLPVDKKKFSLFSLFFQKGSKLFDGGVPDHLKVLAFSQYIIFYNMHCLKFRDIFVLFI